MIKKIDYSKLTTRINSVLELKRNITGIRFLFSEQEFLESSLVQPKKKMPYCKMITKAIDGKIMKVNLDNFGCFAGARSLGIVEVEHEFSSGLYYHNCGLYQDLPTAKNVTDNISICNHKIYGLEIQPLKEFTINPDVIIIITNPYNAMRFIQGYTYKYGVYKSFKMKGNQALCSETTAYPYQENDINFSLLCAGTRRSGLNDDEVSIGITLNKFLGMIDGLIETVTPVENNQKKRVIEKKLKDNNITDIEINYNQNYGDKLRKHDLKFFNDCSKETLD